MLVYHTETQDEEPNGTPISDIYAVHEGTGLSSSIPLGSPHLIDLEKYKATGQTGTNTQLQLADGIATLLYSLGGEILDNFLNKSISWFIIRTDFPADTQWGIVRSGGEVKASNAKLSSTKIE